jgi:hypothetical protein
MLEFTVKIVEFEDLVRVDGEVGVVIVTVAKAKLMHKINIKILALNRLNVLPSICSHLRITLVYKVFYDKKYISFIYMKHLYIFGFLFY